MNLGGLLKEGGGRLTGDTAAMEAEVLLRHLTGLSRAEVYSRLNQSADSRIIDQYFALIDRLKTGEPLQYLTGHIEFYGLDFEVSPAVLIPRPETELMVEAAISIAKDYPVPRIADIGCGSGAVAVALAKNLPAALVTAVDLSLAALQLAGRNAARHQCANITFIESDLLQNVADSHFDIVCANLPYVPAVEAQTNLFEPLMALDGGPDGLNIIRRLISQITDFAVKPRWLLLEFGTGQAETVTDILLQHMPGSHTEIMSDLIPLERISVTRIAS